MKLLFDRASWFEVLLITCLLFPGVGSLAATKTWTGGGADANWATDANWSAAPAPANPTADTIAYNDGGLTVTGVVNAATADWQVGPLSVTNTTGTHVVDLNGKRLIVAGKIEGGRSLGDSVTSRIVFTNGTLQVGSAVVSGTIEMGYDGRGSLKIAANAVLDTTYLSELNLNQGNQRGIGYLDLRGARITGGVLSMQTLRMGSAAGMGLSTCQGYLYLNDQTDMHTLHVRGGASLATGGGANYAYLGNPSDSWKLPAGLNLMFGVSDASRGSLNVAQVTGYHSTAEITATSGGAMTAWLTTFYVGRGTSAHYLHTATGKLDLRNMDSCALDVVTSIIGLGHTNGGSYGVGRVYLPPGTMKTGSLRVGDPNNASSLGLLELYGTILTVTNWARVQGAQGDLNAYIGATPSGLDLEAAATLTIDTGGQLRITFTNAPSGGGTHWGLRWLGNRIATLADWMGDGRLILNHSAVPGKESGLMYDKDADISYVVMVDAGTLPPIAAARDLTIQRQGGGTVWIGVDDVDSGSFDPNTNNWIVSRTISTPGYLGGAEVEEIEFPADGDYTVTLTIKNNLDVTDSADCTVSIVSVPDPVTTDVIWSGAASTFLMERREWFWGDNWKDGAAPANPTVATVFFHDAGQDVTGVLDSDRRIGGLSYGENNNALTHTVDLGGSALTVAGTLQGASGTGLRTLNVTNGTLRLGSDTAAGNITMDYGRLNVRPGSTLDAHNLDTILIKGGNAWIDLRGVIVKDGMLRARQIHHLINRDAGAGSESGPIYLDGQTAITSIVATASLRLGYMVENYKSSGTAIYIGNPSDTFTFAGRTFGRLPAGISLTVGTGVTARAVMGVLTDQPDHWAKSCAALRAAPGGGGRFTAYLSTLRIGDSTYAAGLSRGLLDVSAMDLCEVDAQSVSIARGGTSASHDQRGELHLPPGTATVGTTVVGSVAGVGYGLLSLSNTLFTVTNSLTIRATGDMVVRVGEQAGGLEIVPNDSGALSITTPATLTLRFLAPALAQPHYALRWAGSHTVFLNDMLSDGKLIVDASAIAPKTVEVFERGGFTYVGLKPAGRFLVIMR